MVRQWGGFGRFDGRSRKALTRTDSRLYIANQTYYQSRASLNIIFKHLEVLHLLFWRWKQGGFFYYKHKIKKKHRRGGLKVTRAESGNYCISFLALAYILEIILVNCSKYCLTSTVIMERGSSAVEWRTRNRVSPGSNLPLLHFPCYLKKIFPNVLTSVLSAGGALIYCSSGMSMKLCSVFIR